MDDSQYRYLDEERIKLWRELRKTQEQLAMMGCAAKGDDEGLQKCMMHLGRQVAKAYNRMIERDADTAEIVKTLSLKKDEVESAATAIATAHKTVSENESFVREQVERVKSEISEFDQGMQNVNDRYEELKEKVEAVSSSVEEAKSSSEEIAAKQEDVEEKHDEILGDYKEISKIHSLLFGYTKEDGSIIEGKKQELDNVYTELEEKINSSAKVVEQTESEFKRRCNDAVVSAKAEMDAVTTRLKELLPDALTAGLSSAYLENRKSEEAEQVKQLQLFKRTIGLMLVLALVPIVFNLWLWLFKDLTVLDIIEKLPREMLCIIPLYAPLFWLAIFANKRVNLSKRLIEEYKHKEAVSKTFEGLSTQIAKIEDEKTSKELQARLLYNTVMLSEKNPGELIKNYNRPDNPLLDVLNQSSRFAEAIEKLARVPGIGHIFRVVKSNQEKADVIAKAIANATDTVLDKSSEVTKEKNG